ncbi:integrase family protein [Pelomonas sp. V22]|uniref:tyrosine-type recombinase/integrase n=1 Tax=Pelomonas sp. V22 TaxID=2822139 RepID=UPI0024A907B1|nr:integrase family protein [Pelomonas sp. V22]MDI4634140.1 integrase family protein [Pelomonas sp. V22]
MARPRKTDAPDLAETHDLSAGLIERLTCPAGKQQAFLRDAVSAGLRVRVTESGAKSFVFEAKLNRQTIRRTIGDVRAWTIEDARKEANRLRVTLDKGDDPRELERQAQALKAAQQVQALADAVTVSQAWSRYVVEGRPKRKETWKPRYLADMAKMTAAGGEKRKRGQGVTLPGHLFPLMGLRLSDVDEDTLTDWFQRESRRSKHQAARALMMFRGFLRWCAARPEYRGLIDRDAGKAAAIVEAMPSTVRRTDALEAAQVAGWWTGVEQLPNVTASAYLRALLLTGARREEMAGLRWADVDFQWRKLTIADKVDASRTIPLTPYLAWMLSTLPRAKDADGNPSAFVFASASKSGRIADPRASHAKALQSAAIDGLTIHGLRRSFSLLGEAAGAPAGAIAQVMGHKPSATAEGYRPRSVDALRPFLAQIETHVLGLAGVDFDPAKVHPSGLRVVAAA